MTFSAKSSDGNITITGSRRDWYELAVTLYKHPSGMGIRGDEPRCQETLRTAIEDCLLGVPTPVDHVAIDADGDRWACTCDVGADHSLVTDDNDLAFELKEDR